MIAPCFRQDEQSYCTLKRVWTWGRTACREGYATDASLAISKTARAWKRNRHRKSKMVEQKQKQKREHNARPKLLTTKTTYRRQQLTREVHVPPSCFTPPTTCTHCIAPTTICTTYRLTCKGHTRGVPQQHIYLSRKLFHAAPQPSKVYIVKIATNRRDEAPPHGQISRGDSGEVVVAGRPARISEHDIVVLQVYLRRRR